MPLSPGDWQRLRPLLDQALELPRDRRKAWLDALDGADAALRTDLERLLAREDQVGVVDRGIVQDAAQRLISEVAGPDWEAAQVGRRIGGFELTALLGAGGMGAVYRARRLDAAFEQVVALKLMRGALSGGRERFARERRILAALRHPHIAQLIDGGESEGGEPYLVLEYVEGVPITEYSRTRALDLDARLALLVQVALALGHAHRNLVVHRDLKPSNVLVRADHHPKLLDFGIAKLIGDEAGEALTRQRLGPMTPEFAAPEQFRGEAITVATDVYQLGVLLFVLLTGRLPYAADPSDTLGWARAVSEQQPMTLRSARRTAQGSGAPLPPESLAIERRRLLKGDLDAVVQRALAKAPEQRYPSMDAFADDLVAVREGRPVSARRAGALYHAARFVGRHRAASAIAAVAALALVATTGYALRQAEIARLETARAQRAAERAQSTVEFLEGMFDVADTGPNRAERLTAKTLLARAQARLEADRGDDPALSGQLHAALGRIHVAMAEWAPAYAHYQRAIAGYAGAPDADPRLLARMLERGAWSAQRSSHNADALAWLDRLDPLLPALGTEAAELRVRALATRSIVARDERDFPRAIAFQREAYALAQALPAPGRDPIVVEMAGPLIVLLGMTRAFGESERLIGQARARAEALYGGEDPRTLGFDSVLGAQLMARGELDRAEALLMRTGERMRASAGARAYTVANLLIELAKVSSLRGRYDEGVARALEAASIFAETAGEHSVQRGAAFWTAADVEHARGDAAAERAQLERVRETYGTAVPADSPAWGDLWRDISASELAMARLAEAEAAITRSLAILDRPDRAPGRALALALRVRGDLARARGDSDAGAWYRRALDAIEPVAAADDPLRAALSTLAGSQSSARRPSNPQESLVAPAQAGAQ